MLMLLVCLLGVYMSLSEGDIDSNAKCCSIDY